MPFQTNSTLQTALWRWKPDPSDTVSKQIIINLNRVQYIEASNDNSHVWIYYDLTNTAVTPSPYELSGAPATAFLNDLAAIFV